MKTSKTGYRKTSPDNKEKMLLIPSNNIDMSDTIYDEIYGIPYKAGQPMGEPILMKKGGKYLFKEADAVLEIPREYMDTMKKGGMPKYQPGGKTPRANNLFWRFQEPEQNQTTNLDYWRVPTNNVSSITSVDEQGNPVSIPNPGVLTPEQFEISQAADSFQLIPPTAPTTTGTQTTEEGQVETENPSTTEQPKINTINLSDQDISQAENTATSSFPLLSSEGDDDVVDEEVPNQDQLDLEKYQREQRKLYNPYSSYDTRAAAYTLGRSISGEESVGRGILAGAKIGTSLLRDVASGVGAGKRSQELRKDFEERQRKGLVGGYESRQDGGALTMEDVDSIYNTTGIRFTEDQANNLFIKAPEKTTTPIERPNLGKFEKVNYFDVAQVTPNSIVLNTTPNNPHNAQTINQLLPELRELNPNREIKINYIPNKQSGGAWGETGLFTTNKESNYIEDKDYLEFILGQEYNKLNPNNLPQNYKDNQDEIFNREDVNLEKILLELYNKNNRPENLPQMQRGGQLSTPERLTGEYIQGLPENKEEQGVVEVEDGEHILQPDGNMSEVKGNKHSQGGEKLSAEQIQEDSIVVSDHLKIGKENAKYFKETYDVKVSPKDTYATVVDKIKTKTGLDKINKEQEQVFKDIEKQEKNTEDEGTKNLNLEFLSKKVKELEEEKAQKEQEVKQVLLDVYNKQEESKPKEEQSPQINPEAINYFAEQNGIDPEQAGEIIQEFLKGGKYYNIPKKEDGGVITDPEKIKQIEEFKKTLHSKDNFKNMFEEIVDEQGNKSYRIVENPETPVSEYDSEKWTDFKKQFLDKREPVGKLVTEGTEQQFTKTEIPTPSQENLGTTFPLIDPMEGLADFSQTIPQKNTEKRERSQTDFFNMPDQSVLPPTSIQPPLKVETRLGRADAMRLSPEQQLAENQRTFNSMVQQLNTLPPAQRAAAMASLTAQKTAADNQAMAATGAQNAQIQAETERYNLQKSDAENVAAGQNALNYEDRMFKTQANYEENLQQYYDYNRNLNVAQFNDIRRQNTINSMFENYVMNPDGTVDPDKEREFMFAVMQSNGITAPQQNKTRKKTN